MMPTHDDFTALLDASGLSDREVSMGTGHPPDYVNRVRRGAVKYHPRWYFVVRGYIAWKRERGGAAAGDTGNASPKEQGG